MNFFVILIMGLMLASYQYFVNKKSSNITLNKEELRLQSEINCLKQYHEFASSKNINITNQKIQEYYQLTGQPIANYIPLKSTPTKNEAGHITSNNANEYQIYYSCTGTEDVYPTKYCTNSSGAIISCNSDNVKFHCVSTTKWKKLSQKNKYLISQFAKNGAYSPEKKDNKYTLNIKVTDNNPDGTKNNYTQAIEVLMNTKTETEGYQNFAMGLVSCIDTTQVNETNKINIKCNFEAGEVPEIQADGTIQCIQNVTELNPCTSSETRQELINLTGKTICNDNNRLTTKCIRYVGNKKYCVPREIETDFNKCRTGISTKFCCKKQDENAIWDPITRQYNCKSVNQACLISNVSQWKLLFRDNTNKALTNKDSQTITNSTTTNILKNVFVPVYDKDISQYKCKINTPVFLEECEKITSTDYGFIGLENTNKEIIDSQLNTLKTNNEYIPVCRYSYRENEQAAENCSPCEDPVWDKTNRKWKCEGPKNYNELETKSAEWITKKYNNSKKGHSCFVNCNQIQLNDIKNKKYNKVDGGVAYNSETKLWQCFTCDLNSHYNLSCESALNNKNFFCTYEQTMKKQHIIECKQGNCDNLKKDDNFTKASYTPEELNSKLTNLNCCDRGNLTGYCTSTQADLKCSNNEKPTCTSFICSELYQIQVGSQCYTRWCQLTEELKSKGIEIGKPGDSKCPDTAGWMVFNSYKGCVYCIKQPIQRTED